MAHIGLDAPFQGTGSEGGSEHIVLGLVSGLGKLTDGNERYSILVPPHATDWLLPYLGANQKIVRWPQAKLSTKDKIKKILGPVRKPVGEALRSLGLLQKQDPYAVRPTPVSDGFCESLGLDLLHALYPLNFFKAQVPTLLTVHDLQHRHYPEFFFWNDIPWREKLYPDALAHSKLVTTISWFVGRDVVQQYGVEASKIKVVPWASPTQCYPNDAVTASLARFSLPENFILYPSVTYGHKNHIRLLEAVAYLRDVKGVKVSLVCTGWKKLFWPKIESRLKELRLEEQVRFIGYVTSEEIKAIYKKCTMVVFPTLFEGCGLALLEAFEEGKPVAASDIPPFHEYGLDAPLFFNPTSVEDIAEKIATLWQNENARRRCVERSAPIGKTYRWEKVARTYRAIYRQVLGFPLTEREGKLLEDASLLRDSAIPRSKEALFAP